MRKAITVVIVNAFVALAVPVEALAQGTNIIKICKGTAPSGGTGFSFIWENGNGGLQTSFILSDTDCMIFDVTQKDKFNKITENVPPGWTLTNIACTYTTSAVSITGPNSITPAFEPGDDTVAIDLNEANVTCTFTDQKTAQATAPKDVYAVKFLCGSILPPSSSTHPTNGAPERPVKPGNYLTAINVHNPNRTSISFWKKAVLLYRADRPPEKPEMPMPPYPLREVGLEEDWGLEIDCEDIRRVLLKEEPSLPPAPPAPTFIKGWVVIEVNGGQAHQTAPLPLDVTAVYTSHGYARSGGVVVPQGFAEDVESVLPKRIK